MQELELSGADIEETLNKLILYADRLFFGLAGLRGGGALPGLGEGPEDLAMTVILKFLDPENHTVAWKKQHGPVTPETLLRYLRQVLKNDLFDLLRRKAHTTTVIVDTKPDRQEQEGKTQRMMSLDEFATAREGQDGLFIREQQHARLLNRFEEEPELRDVLAAQLDPDGYQAYTNQELAELLGTTVNDIENRKKRVKRRLLRILAETQAALAREGAHG